MHSITLNQNWKIVRVTLDPPQRGPSRKGNEPIIKDYPVLYRKDEKTAVHFRFLSFVCLFFIVDRDVLSLRLDPVPAPARRRGGRVHRDLRFGLILGAGAHVPARARGD